MTTDDYLFLSALFQGKNLSNVDPVRFKHLAELEIVKYAEHGIEPANGGVILIIGSQLPIGIDELPIETDKHCSGYDSRNIVVARKGC